MEPTVGELQQEILRMQTEIATLKARTDNGLSSPSTARRIFTATLYVLVGYFCLSILLGIGLFMLSLLSG